MWRLPFYNTSFSTRLYLTEALVHFVLLYLLWVLLAFVHSLWADISTIQNQLKPISIWVLVSPLWEEALFRGFLLPLFIRRTSLFWGVLLQALLFAGLHSWDCSSIAFQWAFLSGFYLGGLTCRKQSWGLAFAIHLGINVFSLII